mgnify:CR=1 FL=1
MINRPWLANRVISPGSIILIEVIFNNDQTRKAKYRPVIVLAEVDINSSGTVDMVPLSSTAWGDDLISIEADEDNMLSRDSSAVPSAVFSLDASDVIIRPPKGNVGEDVLNAVYEAIEDVQG